MKLIGRNKGIDRIAEQQQIRLLQFLSQRSKIFLIAFDALAHRKDSEGMLRVQRLQIQRGVDRGGILALGAGIQNKNFHGCSSNS